MYKNPYDLDIRDLKAYIIKMQDQEKYKVLRRYHDEFFFVAKPDEVGRG